MITTRQRADEKPVRVSRLHGTSSVIVSVVVLSHPPSMFQGIVIMRNPYGFLIIDDHRTRTMQTRNPYGFLIRPLSQRSQNSYHADNGAVISLPTSVWENSTVI